MQCDKIIGEQDRTSMPLRARCSRVPEADMRFVFLFIMKIRADSLQGESIEELSSFASFASFKKPSILFDGGPRYLSQTFEKVPPS
jgi:hypothetical protein